MSTHLPSPTRRALLLGAGATLLGAALPARSGSELPEVSDLKPVPELPDPLLTLAGKRITTREGWKEERRPELKRLFEHYMYGVAPKAGKIRTRLEREERSVLGGAATLREIEIGYGPEATPPIHLLLLVPNKRKGPVPAFVGINFCGNHAAVDIPGVRIPEAWIYPNYPGVVNNRATEAGRGTQTQVWNVDLPLERGYAVALFYSGDVDPDRPDFTDGVHPHFLKPGRKEPGPHEWGTIAAWAWGISRVVDYLVTDRDIDRRRIAVVGHSRMGKASLLAGAFDERIALSIPHQAGCGGTAPSRGKIGESVKQINDRFPHWFNDTFPLFNDRPELLPFDQNCLAAMMAPRPVLFSNAQEDGWANPEGQFEVLRAADPVYRLLGVEGLKADRVPPLEQLVDSRLGYYIRPGKHSMNRQDWGAFLAFADRHFK